MPTNPLVAFFRKSNEELKLVPPVAFDIAGVPFDPTKVAQEALLIILDDHYDNIPALKHTNLDANSPLRIIWHNETDEKKKGLGKTYGKPTKVTGFSHRFENSIYQSLLAILQNKGDIQGFVKQWKSEADLAEFDELAAVIQLLSLLDSNAREKIELTDRCNALLKRCPNVLKVSVAYLCKKQQYLKAVQAIEAHVSMMLSK